MFLRSTCRRVANTSLLRSLPAAEGSSVEFTRYTEFDAPKETNLREALNSKEEWIAQEKVHGANFGVHGFHEGREVKFAKRSNFIRAEEFFFGYQRLTPIMTKQAPIVYQLLKEKFRCHIDAFIVYGELFGGKYNHPARGESKEIWMEFRSRMHRIAPIQSDFFPQYSPDIHFFAFELKYRTRPDEGWITCTIDEALSIFQHVPDLLYAKPMLRGSLEHCLAFNMDTYQTVIPHILGFGNMVLPGNFAEGMVLRTATRGGPSETLKNSTILKFKHRMFQESRHKNKIGERDPLLILQREISSRRGETLLLPSCFMNEKEQKSLNTILGMVCDNRLQSTISKYGLDVFCPNSDLPESEKKGFDDLVALLAKDAMKDWLKEATEEELRYSCFVKLMFANYLRHETEKFLQPKWKGIQRGENE
eukprot:PhF_6_TR10811/c0_g1_i1/m.17417